MRALVTGAAGFIGSHLCDRLLADGLEVAGVDSFSDYYSRTVKEDNLSLARSRHNFILYELDLVEDSLDEAFEGVEVVYHFAGRSGVRISRRNQLDHYLRDNVVATQRLLDHASRVQLRRFIYAGSSSVYGDAERLPTKETAVPRPLSFYGLTKLAAENLVLLYATSYGLPGIALRYFNVYGPRQRPDMAIARFMRSIHQDEPVEVYGDGEQTRDFTFVSDAIEATIQASKVRTREAVLNIGGGSRATLNEVLTQLEDIAGVRTIRRALVAPPGDHRHGAASINLARRELTWEPRVSLRGGLELQWAWHVEQARARTSRLVAV